MPISRSKNYIAGDVVVVPFPYSDRFADKRRPALVVSNEAISKAGFVWLSMITSARNEPMPHDIPIADGDGAGLPAASLIRPVKIACIEPSRIIRRAGRLDRTTATKAFEAVRSFVGVVSDATRRAG
jgi:mRNA interferase MazF